MSTKAKSQRAAVGELRPSQLLHTFGIGATVDLPNLSVMVMGLDDWDLTRAPEVREERLLNAVRERLGGQVERLIAPPLPPEEEPGAWFRPPDESALVGVPVAPFPRYARCPACDFLAPLNCGVFKPKVAQTRADRTRYIHENCAKALSPPAILPARFLVACERGHLDDFPWVEFVHRGPNSCRASLVMKELGTGEVADVTVRCSVCDQSRRMVDAFGPDGFRPACRGRRPQLRDFDPAGCPERVRTILLGASNGWFPITLSALYVPPASDDAAAKVVEARWDVLGKVEGAEELKTLRKFGQLGEAAKLTDEQLWEAIEARRSGAGDDDPKDLKAPEWRVFTNVDPARNGPDFRLDEVEPPQGYADTIERVVLASRLREVMALLGFTRIAAPGELADATAPSHRGAISRTPPVVVPAAQVRGEGIFIAFREPRIAEWCTGADEREQAFRRAHVAWRRSRKIEPPDAGFPGIRYVLLHSFAHALIRQLALECGYSAASLRERIYARAEDEPGGPMAGVLIYTAAPDSEGTLGGLVGLGAPAELGRQIRGALARVGLCASDPLCAEHVPLQESGAALHGAACHACLFAPETSCERGNRYLDRLLLIETVRAGVVPFFASSPP